MTGDYNVAKVWDAKLATEILILRGHSGSVYSVSINADGTRVLTGSHDKTVELWDVKTGAEVLTLKGHTSEVVAASFSTDGAMIATGSLDNTAKIWDSRPFGK